MLIGLIRFYQRYLSMLKGHPTCKYFPTCSQYAIEALEEYLDVILFLKEDMIPFHKGGQDVSNSRRRSDLRTDMLVIR